MPGKELIAYHNDPMIKRAVLSQLAAHRAADEIIQGTYWENGKGCAVGCAIYSGDHVEYETRFGIPQMLAHLEDRIFEGMTNDKAQEWPERFMGAIRPGADLSLVGWKFLRWLLTDESVNSGIKHPLVRDAIKQCADVLIPLTNGHPVDEESAWSAAKSAESEAWSARVARAARVAESAAAAAEAAARSARSAMWSARSAARAAWLMTESAGSMAKSAAASSLMADKLIELLAVA